jgi:uncharacterized membrane protein HdeD (DUF308 family)
VPGASSKTTRLAFDCGTNRRGILIAQTDRQSELVHALVKSWWLLLLRGMAAIIFGVLVFAWPGITLLTLVPFYCAYTLVDGVLAIIAGGGPAPRWRLVIIGLLGIAAGLLTLLMPAQGMTELGLAIGNHLARARTVRLYTGITNGSDILGDDQPLWLRKSTLKPRVDMLLHGRKLA